ncbi:MAG: SDR family NAD(P)-dependent oxidoreductase [Pseudomonadota bacterium]
MAPPLFSVRSEVQKNVVIIGTGAIASALATHFSADLVGSHVTVLGRDIAKLQNPGVATRQIDFLDESSIADAASHVASIAAVDTVIVATGILHDDAGLQPEKRLADLTPENALQSFTVNALAPTLIAKHMLPLMRKDRRNVFAALSARVGSIEDNRLGGWYSYRASKAALNMFLKSASIEQARSNKHSIVVGLHPGTVDSNLSKPFQKNVPDGGLFEPNVAAGLLVEVLDRLTPESSGGVFAWDGTRVPA